MNLKNLKWYHYLLIALGIFITYTIIIVWYAKTHYHGILKVVFISRYAPWVWLVAEPTLD